MSEYDRIEQELLADLNEPQSEAVRHIDGPLLILAAAGSGKTRVITRRIAYLLHSGVRPQNILAITFTNKAANEMRRRVEELVPCRGMWIGTFHAMGARLLRVYADRLGLDKNFTIYDQTDRLRVTKMAMEDAGVNTDRITPDSVMNAISKAKNQMLSPDKFAGQANDFFSLSIAKVYGAYDKRMRDLAGLDFDDLLYWPALALKNDPELRRELDDRFRHVLIDEYQDTNTAQYQIARLLSVDHPNLCVVGDPDQSIYSFRGADIRNILAFERDFPKARVLTLGFNYRSTRHILEAAGGLITHNIQRKHKDLLTTNDSGAKVNVLHYVDGSAEADGIARTIRDMVTSGKRKYRDFAVFVRMNALTRSLELALTQARVPFQIVKGTAFFDRKENRDILGYLRLLVNNRDDVSFERVINEPSRGIGQVTLTHLKMYAETNELSLLQACNRAEFIPAIKGKAGRGLSDFAQLMKILDGVKDGPPDEVVRQVIERSGYRKMLTSSGDEEDQRRLENVEELITAAKQFAEADSSATISDFLENITLASDADGYDAEQDAVSVMTLHVAKGLEFPVVFVVAVEQGILPHQRAMSSNKPDDIEEERRLLFVGMTRAREELFLTLARKVRQFRGQDNYPIASMYLGELPPHAVTHTDHSGVGVPGAGDRYRSGGTAARIGWRDAGVDAIPLPSRPSAADPYRVGVLVKEPRYGVGTIIEVNGAGATRTVKIRFPKHGVSSFRVDMAKLEVIG